MLEKIKSFLGLKTDEKDGIIFQILESVINQAELILNSPLQRREVVKQYIGGGFLVLSQFNPEIKEIFYYEGEQKINLNLSALTITKQGVFLPNETKDKIIYVRMEAGFSDQLPAGLEHIIVCEVAKRFLESGEGQNLFGVQSMSESGVTGSFSKSFSFPNFIDGLKLWKVTI